jgi:threonine dehydrogenase-like Zn-dependent dehydrogenase
MKTDAIFMTGVRQTEIRQVELSVPQPHEVQIEVFACGVCAWDAYLFKGKDMLQPHPFGFGHEAVGIIREVGKEVTRFSPGDRVFCTDEGPQRQMAQWVNINAESVGFLPKTLEKTEDFLPYIGEPCVCVINGLRNITITPGDSVAIIGTGYMGLLNVEAFRYSHTGSIYCFDIDEKKLVLAKELGADQCWLSNSPEGQQAAKDIIAAGGVDITVECSGSQAGLTLATDLVRNAGTIANFAWHRAERTVDASPWHLRGLRIINTSPSLDRHFTDNVIPTERVIARGVFKQEKLITHVMDYHKIQDMLTIAEAKSDNYIKGVVTF